MATISLPQLSLVVLIGPSGSGKSTFARRHFLPTEILSSDAFRGMVADDENDQSVTKPAFELLHQVARKRLEHGRLTVVDATNVQMEARKPLVELARSCYVLPVAIIFNLPERICQERNVGRPDRNFGSHVVRQQRSQLRRSLRGLRKEGFRNIFVFDSPEEVDEVTIERVPLWTDKRSEHGPFDIIGDLHGCADELETLLGKLGYAIAPSSEGDVYAHPEGRRAVFLGDLVDRGPRILDTLEMVRRMVRVGHALCVPGNHDVKFLDKLRGKNVRITHGLQSTLDELEELPEREQEKSRRELVDFLGELVSHYVLDDGKLVVAHAGMKESMQGRAAGAVRSFALYGETTGETDEFGLPVRVNWAEEYRGNARVVYGHTPVHTSQWVNRTINIDTGCVFGGALTALCYPEMELVSVPAARTYFESAKPLLQNPEAVSLQHQLDDTLDIEDVIGKRIITTRHGRTITIREENAAAALEVMSRYAINPKWMIYLPPTMSPCETSTREGPLEEPTGAFEYYRSEGIERVICEEKHMGSRAVVVVCRDQEVARARFGVHTGDAGVVYTRTGRPFFTDEATTQEFLQRIRSAFTSVGWWDTFETGWFCLDGEILPWSAKAQELIRSQFATVGSASLGSLPAALRAIESAAARLWGENQTRALDARDLLSTRMNSALRYVDAYRRYCWPVRSINDVKFAPFQILCSEGKVHLDRDHAWHMTQLAELADHGPGLLVKTEHRLVELADESSVAFAEGWWEHLTHCGGEGMVVKPMMPIVRGKHGLVQPGVKCRGPEYLRIIYGPDYQEADNITRLRHRGLGRKRSLALREFALGIEAMERFIAREPLRRIHECVFGVLAMESEPVDPRL